MSFTPSRHSIARLTTNILSKEPALQPSRTWQQAMRGTLCAGALSILLAACGGNGNDAPKAAPELQTVGYVTIATQSQELQTELAGRTRAAQSAEIRPQVSGIVQQRLFTEGSIVKAGEPLYEIDARSFQAAVKSAEAALARAKTVAETARTNAARNAELVKIDAISRQVYDESQALAAQTAAEVAVAQAALENANINLQYSRVVAPFTGQIGLSSVSPGALVSANQADALTTLMQLDPIHVDITQSSAEILNLKRQWQAGAFGKVDSNNARVQLILEDGSRYNHTGTLQFSGTSVNTTSGAVTLRASFPNPDRLLMPGMYVRARLATGVAPSAILVPQIALSRDASGDPFVQIINAEDTLEKRPVQVGQAIGSNWLVLQGLAAGDRVMADGFQKARIGQKVQPVAVQSKAAPAAGDATPSAAESGK